jgi:hypothetical protein
MMRCEATAGDMDPFDVAPRTEFRFAKANRCSMTWRQQQNLPRFIPVVTSASLAVRVRGDDACSQIG